MQLKNKTILIISNEPWGNIWYSKHNWAYELSKNNMVYFINPPKRWRFYNLFATKIRIKNYSESLKILDYNNRLPFTRFYFLFKINEGLIYKALNNFFKDKTDIIFWTFDPFRLINPKKLKVSKSIYFIADKYLINREKILINNVEHIFSVSKELTKDINHKSILNLSHGISKTEFYSDKDIAEKNYLLYIGGVDYRLDYDLIEELLKNFIDEKFLFIGRISKINNDAFKRIFIEKKYDNLIYKPAIHFKELKNYINNAKVCLAPMKLGVQGNSINHHKLLQYMAFGKPILSAKFDDYKNTNLLFEYSNGKEAVDILNTILAESESNNIVLERINYTKQFLYENLIIKIESFINE